MVYYVCLGIVLVCLVSLAYVYKIEILDRKKQYGSPSPYISSPCRRIAQSFPSPAHPALLPRKDLESHLYYWKAEGSEQTSDGKPVGLCHAVKDPCTGPAFVSREAYRNHCPYTRNPDYFPSYLECARVMDKQMLNTERPNGNDRECLFYHTDDQTMSFQGLRPFSGQDCGLSDKIHLVHENHICHDGEDPVGGCWSSLCKREVCMPGSKIPQRQSWDNVECSRGGSMEKDFDSDTPYYHGMCGSRPDGAVCKHHKECESTWCDFVPDTDIKRCYNFQRRNICELDRLKYSKERKSGLPESCNISNS